MLTIIEANADDARRISQLFSESWKHAYRHLLPHESLSRLPEGYWVPTLRAWLGSGQMYGLLALDGDEPMGCIIYGRGRDPRWPDEGEIVNLYVRPGSLRRGIGSRLLAEAERQLRLDGYSRFYLWAIEGSGSADSFYRKHGYAVAEERISYHIYGTPVSDVRYTKEHRE